MAEKESIELYDKLYMNKKMSWSTKLKFMISYMRIECSITNEENESKSESQIEEEVCKYIFELVYSHERGFKPKKQ